MKIKIFLYTLIFLIISSCSVFRKSEKHKVEINQADKTEEVKEVQESKAEKGTTDRKQTEVTDSKSNSVTVIEADEVTINADGTVSAKGNVRALQNRNDNNASKKEGSELTTKETNAETNTRQQAASSWDLGIKTYDKKPEKASNPIYNWIGAGLLILILAGGAHLFFKLR